MQNISAGYRPNLKDAFDTKHELFIYRFELFIVVFPSVTALLKLYLYKHR